jgi:hypothetical protein
MTHNADVFHGGRDDMAKKDDQVRGKGGARTPHHHEKNGQDWLQSVSFGDQ